MTDAGFWKNDAQVASETCEKIWSATPGLYICAEEIGADNGTEKGKENELWQMKLY